MIIRFRCLECTVLASADATLMRYIPLVGIRSANEAHLPSELKDSFLVLLICCYIIVLDKSSTLETIEVFIFNMKRR